jgi:hypothetical protein
VKTIIRFTIVVVQFLAVFIDEFYKLQKHKESWFFYYPGIDLIKQTVWNCVLMDAEIANKVTIVFDKLKSE